MQCFLPSFQISATDREVWFAPSFDVETTESDYFYYLFTVAGDNMVYPYFQLVKGSNSADLCLGYPIEQLKTFGKPMSNEGQLFQATIFLFP